MENRKKSYFQNWNYKKHSKTCAILYGSLFVLDMTLGYVLAKKILNCDLKGQNTVK